MKRRYYIWLDADHLLRADHALLGMAADALMGVAAEAEYSSDDRLVIHRAVFIGGPALDVYAEDERGQFCTWAAHARRASPWPIATGLSRPPVRRYRIRAVAATEQCA